MSEDSSHEGGKSLLDSLLSGGLIESLLSEPLLSLRVLLDKSWSLLNNFSNWFVLSLLSLLGWALSNGIVDFLVKVFELGNLSGSKAFFPLTELFLESSSIFLFKSVVICFNMTTEDVFLVNLWVEGALGLFLLFNLTSLVGCGFSFLNSVSWESLFVVWNVKTSITGTLESSEDSVTSGGAYKTNIEVGLEWSTVTHLGCHIIDGTVDFGVTLVHISHLLFSKKSAGNKETSCVSSGVVGKTSSKSVLLEFVRVSSGHSSITSEGGIVNRADDSSVGSSYDKSVLLGIVLVLVLENKSSSGEVVSLSFSSSSELGLISLGVSFVLQNLNETHGVI